MIFSRDISRVLQSYPVSCLGTQDPLQNHLQKWLEHKGFIFLNGFEP